MTTSETTPLAGLRCPSCSALRTPDATWCSQCYTRFELPSRAGDPAAAPVGGGAGSGPATGAAPTAERIAAALAAEASAWDLRYRQTADELDEETKAARIEEAMAAFSGTESTLSPNTRKLAGFTSTPVGKLVVITCGGGLLLGLGLLVMVLADKFA